MLIDRAYRGIRHRIRSRTVAASWHRAERKGTIDARIPPPKLNYNQGMVGLSLASYVDEFTSQACNQQLPALLDIAGYRDDSQRFTLLDYGCGLGRIGYAFTQRFGRDDRRRYIGYEIHPKAVEFLESAYRAFPNVALFSDRLALSDSYVEISQSAKPSEEGIAADTVVLTERIGEPVDLQFSHSVFTHMYRGGVIHVLNELGSLVTADGLCVNTWLLVDDEARANMASGDADRKLPIAGDGFLTYSRENPLICTAYLRETAESIYEAAGQEIVDVQWGTWSGRKPSQGFTYQDVVISRPRP
jgi:SAM-dependent methyltransferase